MALIPFPNVPGNEPIFARLIFESLSLRYAAALANLENMLGRKLKAIHMLGGANRNKLLVELTEQRTGLPIQIGQTESSTIGSLAVQLASSDADGQPPGPQAIRKWAAALRFPHRKHEGAPSIPRSLRNGWGIQG